MSSSTAVNSHGWLQRKLLRFEPSALIPLAIAIVIVYLSLVPVGKMVFDSFQTESGALSFANYRTILTSSTAYRLMGGSLVFAIGSSVLGTAIGTVLAWLVERTNMPGRRILFGAALVPLIMPGSLATFAWIFILSPNVGIINVILQNLFGFNSGPLNIFSMPGMIFIEGIHLSTLTFLMMAGAFRSMDSALEEASAASGAGIIATALRVTLPLLRPALASTLLIGFVRAVESFEVPAMIGLPGRQNVLASQIYLALQTYPINYGGAGAYATMLFILGAVGVLLYLRVISRGGFATVSGKGFRPRVVDLGGFRVIALAFACVYSLLLFVLPALLMIWASFQPYYASPSAGALKRMSFSNYAEVFHNSAIIEATRTSLILGVASATVIVLFSAVTAWITQRTRLRGRQALDVLAFVPIAIPGLVLGVAMVELYGSLPIPIYGTIFILIIAYVIKFLPYGMRSSTAAIAQVSGELEEAASVSGANWFDSFFRVLLPLLRPGLFAAWIYIFLVSTRELSTSIILSSQGTTPLAVQVFSMYNNGDYTLLSALGVVIVAGLSLLVWVFQLLGGSAAESAR